VSAGLNQRRRAEIDAKVKSLDKELGHWKALTDRERRLDGVGLRDFRRYGCLCMGPAFVGAMMDLLSASVASVQNESRSGGKYPTRALRVELMLGALQRDHAADAARLRATWEDVYGPLGKMLEFSNSKKTSRR
jgi:hypothetical protein